MSMGAHSEDAKVRDVMQEESCYLSTIHLHVCSQDVFLTMEKDQPGDNG